MCVLEDSEGTTRPGNAKRSPEVVAAEMEMRYKAICTLIDAEIAKPSLKELEDGLDFWQKNLDEMYPGWKHLKENRLFWRRVAKYYFDAFFAVKRPANEEQLSQTPRVILRMMVLSDILGHIVYFHQAVWLVVEQLRAIWDRPVPFDAFIDRTFDCAAMIPKVIDEILPALIENALERGCYRFFWSLLEADSNGRYACMLPRRLIRRHIGSRAESGDVWALIGAEVCGLGRVKKEQMLIAARGFLASLDKQSDVYGTAQALNRCLEKSGGNHPAEKKAASCLRQAWQEMTDIQKAKLAWQLGKITDNHDCLHRAEIFLRLGFASADSADCKPCLRLIRRMVRSGEDVEATIFCIVNSFQFGEIGKEWEKEWGDVCGELSRCLLKRRRQMIKRMKTDRDCLKVFEFDQEVKAALWNSNAAFVCSMMIADDSTGLGQKIIGQLLSTGSIDNAKVASQQYFRMPLDGVPAVRACGKYLKSELAKMSKRSDKRYLAEGDLLTDLAYKAISIDCFCMANNIRRKTWYLQDVLVSAARYAARTGGELPEISTLIITIYDRYFVNPIKPAGQAEKDQLLAALMGLIGFSSDENNARLCLYTNWQRRPISAT